MSLLSNFTGLPAALWVGRDERGHIQLAVAVKQTFRWDASGAALADAPLPFLEQDQYAGDPATSGLIAASETGPPKPRVDVILKGAAVFRAPIVEAEAALAVGRRLWKSVRIFGDRHWIESNGGLVASRPRAVARLPLEWERSFGGADPADPGCFEPRNPVGRGVARRSRDLVGHPAPNFETPATARLYAPEAPQGWPAPCGLSAVAPHWQPRVAHAGTYDDAWRADRCPLPPTDFNPSFFNQAPADQQLEGYVAGEEVRLDGMTTLGFERFFLPPLRLPVVFRSTGTLHETYTREDTVVIEPEQRRFSVIARAAFTPRPNVLAMRQVLLGPLTPGRRRAVETGKNYLDLRARAGA